MKRLHLLAGSAMLSLGLFSGQGYAEGVTMLQQMGVQLVGVLATGTYAAVVTLLLLKLVQRLVGLRVTSEDEIRGLDTAQHNERGYDIQLN